jgi:hypothetical protein
MVTDKVLPFENMQVGDRVAVRIGWGRGGAESFYIDVVKKRTPKRIYVKNSEYTLDGRELGGSNRLVVLTPEIEAECQNKAKKEAAEAEARRRILDSKEAIKNEQLQSMLSDAVAKIRSLSDSDAIEYLREFSGRYESRRIY